MSSCNFGTLASFARLPIRDVVVRSSVKSGGMLMVRTGTTEVGVGGVITICNKKSLKFPSCDFLRCLTEDLNCESEMVNETGRRAKDDMG